MNTITIPRETFDQMKRALEEACGNRCNAEYNPCYAREALAAANAVPKPTVPDNSQEWKGMDGTTAYHLITRHADGWADVGKMMDEWLAANQEVSEPEIVAIEGMPQGLGNEPEILAEYTGTNGVRQWASVGAWLYNGDAIAVISNHFEQNLDRAQPQAGVNPLWLATHPDGLQPQAQEHFGRSFRKQQQAQPHPTPVHVRQGPDGPQGSHDGVNWFRL